MLQRRGLLLSALAAPLVASAGNLMPVKPWVPPRPRAVLRLHSGGRLLGIADRVDLVESPGEGFANGGAVTFRNAFAVGQGWGRIDLWTIEARGLHPDADGREFPMRGSRAPPLEAGDTLTVTGTFSLD